MMTKHVTQIARFMGLGLFLSCIASPVHGYNNGGHDGVCSVCPENMYCTSSNGTFHCPEHSNSSVGTRSLSDCLCQAGYQGTNGSICTECAVGSYKDVVGDSPCLSCPNNTYTDIAAASSCLSCPEHTFSYGISSTSRDDCVCLAGFSSANSSECTACGAGEYKTRVGDGSCLMCAAGTYSSAIAATASCMSCPQNSMSPVGSKSLEDCVCDIGYEGGGNMHCKECDTGSYKNETGMDRCHLCHPNTYSDTRHASNCSDCPLNTKSGPSAGTKSIVDCLCVPGYKRTNAGCKACGPSTYSDVAGATSCSPCPAANMISPYASTRPQNCSCVAGYTGDYIIGCTLNITTAIGITITTSTPTTTIATTPQVVETTSSITTTPFVGPTTTPDTTIATTPQVVETTSSNTTTPFVESATTPDTTIATTPQFETQLEIAMTTTSTPIAVETPVSIIVPDGSTSAIELTISVELRVEDFTNYARTQFVENLADALSVEPSSIGIASITELSRRRLLTPSSVVATVITVPSEATESIVAAVTYENLSAALATAGFTIGAVSTPTITRINPTPRRELSNAEKRLIFMLGSCPCVT